MTDLVTTLVLVPTAPQHDTVFLAAARAAQPLVEHLGAGSWPRVRPLVHACASHPLVAVREAIAQSLPALARYEGRCCCFADLCINKRKVGDALHVGLYMCT